jgi:hypothetical protein
VINASLKELFEYFLFLVSVKQVNLSSNTEYVRNDYIVTNFLCYMKCTLVRKWIRNFNKLHLCLLLSINNKISIGKRVLLNEVNYLCAVVLGIEFSLFALFMCILGIIPNKCDWRLTLVTKLIQFCYFNSLGNKFRPFFVDRTLTKYWNIGFCLPW